MARIAYLGLATMILVLEMIPNVRSHTKQFTLYAQVIFAGSNSNIIPVAGALGQPRDALEFGTVYVGDILLTRGVSIDSLPIGRSQGLQITTSVNGTETAFAFAFSFTDGEFRGSTLEFQGLIKVSTETGLMGELSITGGTINLRHARGYARFESVPDQIPTDNAVVNKFDITLKYGHV